MTLSIAVILYLVFCLLAGLCGSHRRMNGDVSGTCHKGRTQSEMGGNGSHDNMPRGTYFPDRDRPLRSHRIARATGTPRLSRPTDAEAGCGGYSSS